MNATLVTVSYGPDRAVCERLCRSVDEHVDDALPHLLVVPRRDRAAFAHLAHGRRELRDVESILDGRVRPLPGSQKWWLVRGALPVRGWIMQQVTKLATAASLDTDACVFVDSDVQFVRPVQTEDLFEPDGRVPLLSMPGQGTKDTHRRWHESAARLLGLPPQPYFGADYIGQLVAWIPQRVRDLGARIETVTGRDWRTALFRSLHFSEYILYGVFIEHAYEGDHGHAITPREICHCSWHFDVLSDAGLAEFERSLAPHHRAVLIQSNKQFSLEQRAASLRRMLALASRGEPVVKPVLESV